MSAKKILGTVGKVENLITNLDNDINKTLEQNSKLLLSIENLVRYATKIIEAIDGWFLARENARSAKVEQNLVAVEKGEKLKANLEKLFE